MDLHTFPRQIPFSYCSEMTATLKKCNLLHSRFKFSLYVSCYYTCISEHAAAAAKSFSRVWLCDPRDGSLPGSPIPGFLQARTLEWVTISFSNAWKWKVKVKSLSHVWLVATPWIAAHQAPPSMGFSRQEYWSGVPLPSPSVNILGPI